MPLSRGISWNCNQHIIWSCLSQGSLGHNPLTSSPSWLLEGLKNPLQWFLTWLLAGFRTSTSKTHSHSCSNAFRSKLDVGQNYSQRGILFPTEQELFEKEKERERSQFFVNSISEVTSYFMYYILFKTSDLLSQVYTQRDDVTLGYKYQKVGTVGSHFKNLPTTDNPLAPSDSYSFQMQSTLTSSTSPQKSHPMTASAQSLNSYPS